MMISEMLHALKECGVPRILNRDELRNPTARLKFIKLNIITFKEIRTYFVNQARTLEELTKAMEIWENPEIVKELIKTSESQRRTNRDSVPGLENMIKNHWRYRNIEILGFVEDGLIWPNLKIPGSTDPDGLLLRNRDIPGSVNQNELLPPNFEVLGLPDRDEEFFGPFFNSDLQ
jgi:hypothetical protein